MADFLSVEERSRRMSRIRSKDTKPELQLRHGLFARGFRYRLHVRELPGKPDLVFPRHRVVILVQGCFWHGHKCKIGHIPNSNSEFWKEKVRKNRARDAKNIMLLRKQGWQVLLVWECRLGTKAALKATLENVIGRLTLTRT